MIPKFRAWYKHFKVMKKVGQITFTEAVWDCQPEQQNDTENKAGVFQGDIVWRGQNGDYGVIEIDEGKFVIRWQDGYSEDLFERIDLLEAIGNIHEHSHLLDDGGQQQ